MVTGTHASCGMWRKMSCTTDIVLAVEARGKFPSAEDLRDVTWRCDGQHRWDKTGVWSFPSHSRADVFGEWRELAVHALRVFLFM